MKLEEILFGKKIEKADEKKKEESGSERFKMKITDSAGEVVCEMFSEGMQVVDVNVQQNTLVCTWPVRFVKLSDKELRGVSSTLLIEDRGE